ncbi:metallophosphoesterase [Fervidicella metallireducens]|uniref:metallophosphoesterase n=1 Tax=Fervidicella metallireducens TaxID=655338 RepID=UPI0006883DE9|nr:metallophosphoesterase [Fervidicella metallireducens]
MLLTVVVILIYGTWNAEHPIVKTYDINLSKKAGRIKSLNIALVTDIHIGKIIGNGRVLNMVNQINSLNPDIVIIAGDIVDNGVEPFVDEKIVETLRGIKAPLGTYAVPGNHDLMKGQLDKLIFYLESANIKMLIDNSIRVKDGFYIVGRMDASSQRAINIKRKDLKDLVMDLDKTLPIILVDHQPVDLDIAEKEGIDIQLSGHTHRGQLFPNQIFTRRIYEIDWGHLKKGNFNVVVSSGFGTWGPRLRIGNKPEVVNIKVHFAK